MTRRDLILQVLLSSFYYSCSSTYKKSLRSETGNTLLLFQNNLKQVPPWLNRQGLFPSEDENKLVLLNLSDLTHRIIPLQIKAPHSGLFYPQKNEIVVISKGENTFSVVQLGQMSKEIVFLAPREMNFYGHATIVANKNELLISAYDRNSYRGSILVYDLESYKFKMAIDSFGDVPHDICFFEEGGILCVANNGTVEGRGQLNGVTNFVWIDYQTKRLIKLNNQFSEIGYNQHFHGHDPENIILAMDSKGRSEQSLIVKIKNGISTKFDFPDWKSLQGNILSLSVDSEFEHVITTTPEHYPVLWDINSCKSIRTLSECQYPHGASFNRKLDKFLISTAQQGIWLIDKVGHPTRLPGTEKLKNISAHSSIISL